MNRLRFIFSFLIIFMLSPMHRAVAQGTEALSDSLVYSIAMYKELYKDYTDAVTDFKFDLSAVVAEVFGIVESAADFTIADFNDNKVNMPTKLKDLSADLFLLFDLTEQIEKKYGVAIPEEQAVQLSTVEDIFNLVRPTGDTIMLGMAYYPWRMVFDSRKVHRVGVYEDGINILTDMVKLITDTIQRGIYLDELMNIYDVWYEYVDTINKRMDVDFSRTLIKSNKARKYDELLPILYGLKWDVGKDTLNSKAIQDYVFTPEVCRLYNYMQDALYEPDGKEDLYYEIPYKFFRLSHSRLFQLNKLGRYQTYAEQYAKDFDSVNVRFEFYKSLALRQNVEVNITYRHNEVADMYDAASGAMIIGSSKNWREKEVEFRKQLYEKMDLWDFGLDSPDPKFLNRIINGINTDSSEVYVEALERYIALPATQEIFANIQKYRERLARIYGKNQRYTESAKLYNQVAIDTKDNPRAKAQAYFNAAMMYYNAKEFSNTIRTCKYAIREEANFGDAYYYLGLAYAQSHWIKNWDRNNDNRVQDSFIQLLAIDKYELALQKIRAYANDPELGKLNGTAESRISSSIEVSKKYSPVESDVFFFEDKFKKGGTLTILNEQVKVRFY